MTTDLLPAFLTAGRALCTPATANLFWSTQPGDETAAKDICQSCPLRDACAQYALDTDQHHGTWGGLTAKERLQLRRGTGWWIDQEGRARPPCGPVGAHRMHLRYKEQPCEVCTAGQEQRTLERRLQLLAVEHALPAGGSVKGYDTHRRMGEEACGPCKAAKSAANPPQSVRARQRAVSHLAAARSGRAAA